MGPPRRCPLDRRAAAGLAALVSLAGLGWAVIAGPLSGPAVPSTSGQVASITDPAQVADAGRGFDLYQASCAACHGQAGTGTASGPAIADAGAALTDFMLRTGRMPAPQPGEVVRRTDPVFGDADIRALVDYVASLGTGAPIPNVQVTSATDTAAGRAAYVATCAACHGAGASGDAVGGGSVAPPLLDTAPTQVGEAIRTGPGNMPAFDATQVSDQQLSEIAGYLQFLKSRAASPGGAPLGGIGPVVEGYVAWLAYFVALLGITRWIERRRHRPAAGTGQAPE